MTITKRTQPKTSKKEIVKKEIVKEKIVKEKIVKEKIVKEKIVKEKTVKKAKIKIETITDFTKFRNLIVNDPFEMEHHIYNKSCKYNKSSKKTMLKEIGFSVITIKRLYGQLLIWIMNVGHTNKYSFGEKLLLYVDIKNKKLNVDLKNMKLIENDKSTLVLYDYYFIILVEINEIIVDYMRQIYGVVFPVFDEKIKHKNENIQNMIIISDFIMELRLNTNNFEYEASKKYYLENKETITIINLLIFNLIREELHRNINYYYEQVFISIGISI